MLSKLAKAFNRLIQDARKTDNRAYKEYLVRERGADHSLMNR